MKKVSSTEAHGALQLSPIPAASLEQFQATFKDRTLPKIREDMRRNARNVAVAREKVA